MNLDFEKYEAGQKTGGEYISLGKMTISFYKDFLKRYNLQAIKTIDLYYNRETETVACKFFEDKTGGITVIKPEKGNSYINAKGFYKAKNINVDEVKGQYEPKRIQHNNLGELFVIELKERNQT